MMDVVSFIVITVKIIPEESSLRSYIRVLARRFICKYIAIEMARQEKGDKRTADCWMAVNRMWKQADGQMDVQLK
jgi:hypothetical protein